MRIRARPPSLRPPFSVARAHGRDSAGRPSSRRPASRARRAGAGHAGSGSRCDRARTRSWRSRRPPIAQRRPATATVPQPRSRPGHQVVKKANSPSRRPRRIGRPRLHRPESASPYSSPPGRPARNRPSRKAAPPCRPPWCLARREPPGTLVPPLGDRRGGAAPLGLADPGGEPVRPAHPEPMALAGPAQGYLNLAHPMDAVARHPRERHPRRDDPLDHAAREVRLGRKGNLPRHVRRGPARRVVGPGPRQVEGPADKGVPLARDIGCEHADPAAGDLAPTGSSPVAEGPRAGVLSGHPAGRPCPAPHSRSRQ
jgi:hypothetical protein